MALLLDYSARRFTNWRILFAMLKFAVTLLALMLPTITASAQAEDGRIHITFFKGDRGSGSGYLFYQGQRHGLGISAANIGRVRATIDLLGTASNLRSASDIIGTYNAADPQAGILKRARIARIENGKGVVLEVRAVNLGRWSSLNLSGLTITALGWQPAE